MRLDLVEDMLEAEESGAPDLFALLGVPRDAATSDVRRAYRRLSRTLHPDKVLLYLFVLFLFLFFLIIID